MTQNVLMLLLIVLSQSLAGCVQHPATSDKASAQPSARMFGTAFNENYGQMSIEMRFASGKTCLVRFPEWSTETMVEMHEVEDAASARKYTSGESVAPQWKLVYQQLDASSGWGTLMVGDQRFALRLSVDPELRYWQTPSLPRNAAEEIPIRVVSNRRVIAGTYLKNNAGDSGRGDLRRLVFLVNGGGNSDRWYGGAWKELAATLVASGEDVVVIDDPGSGGSSGAKPLLRFVDSVTDIQNVIVWVQNHRTYDETVVVGHSEGGQLAMVVAANDAGVRAVAICSPIQSPYERLCRQSWLTAIRAADVPENDEQNLSSILSEVCRGYPDEQKLRGGVEAARQVLQASNVANDKQDVFIRFLGEQFIKAGRPRNQNQINWDAAPYLAAAARRITIVYGGNDDLVDANQNVSAARELEFQGPIFVVAGMGHALQGGEIFRSPTRPSALCPELISIVVDAVRQTAKRGRSASSN